MQHSLSRGLVFTSHFLSEQYVDGLRIRNVVCVTVWGKASSEPDKHCLYELFEAAGMQSIGAWCSIGDRESYVKRIV